MNQSEHNFQDLKRLLKLKRHEVPPPGYFHGFSGDVIARIKAGDAGEALTFMESLQEKAPWLFNLVRLFEVKPAVVGGLATSLCVLMVFGLVLTENSETVATVEPTLGAQTDATVQAAQMASANGTPMSASGSGAIASSGITMSTNPVTSLQPMGGLFGQPAQSSLFVPTSVGVGN